MDAKKSAGEVTMSAVRSGGPAVKAMTFACVHFIVAFRVAYLPTGSAGISGLLAFQEPMVNTVAF
jgi:hypothetical protein